MKQNVSMQKSLRKNEIPLLIHLAMAKNKLEGLGKEFIYKIKRLRS
jgi:hypothetical protein